MWKVHLVAAEKPLRLPTAALSVAVMCLWPTLTNAAHAAEQTAVVCGRSGEATITPGLTATPKEFRVIDVGTLGPCRMPDGSIQSGTVSASGRGNGSCGTVTISGVFTISWSNGKTSKGTVEVVSAGAAFLVTPKVTEGLFAGGPAISVIFPTVADPSACASTGLSQARYAGAIGFTALS